MTQCYATLDELNEDSEGAAGIPVSVLRRFILPASTYIAGEFGGSFLPGIETRTRTGKGTDVLFVEPLLRLTAPVVNGSYSIQVTDISLRRSFISAEPFWDYGPYGILTPADIRKNSWSWFEIPNCISIPGVWGLYERSQATGATLSALQLINATSLSVANGALLSPGMVLQIETEWQYVADYGSITAAITTLSSSLDASSEILSVASGAALNIGEVIKIDFELMKVLDIQTNSVMVTRGWNNTKKTTHTSSTGISVYRSYTVERAVNGSTAIQHASSTAISQMRVPDDINYLCRQIATLMMKKSQTGYAGKSGNATTGETFYNFEFPRDAIERIKGNYYIYPLR